jgi:beta-phosphoglucomutase
LSGGASFEAILFDFDGVLVDSEPLHYECWCEIIAPHGLVLTWENYAANCIGVSDRAMIETLCRVTGRPGHFEAIWAEYPAKKALFRRRAVEKVPMPPPTREVLGALDGYRLAVVSSSGRAEIEPVLEAAGVRRHFETIVTGEDVRELKPSPEPYRTAADRLGITRALVIEDSPAGIASGRAAGFEVLEIARAEEMAGLLRTRLSRRD